MSSVRILRGLPGSGKTYYADRQNAYVCSADSYFLVNGTYKFDVTKLKEAHNQCFSSFMEKILDESRPIIVDNTNINAWEIAPYYRVAEYMKRDVEIITFWCSVEQSITRNTHCVPASTIIRMYADLINNQLPTQWKHRVLK